jgi:CBS-domain-containing membrane protein
LLTTNDLEALIRQLQRRALERRAREHLTDGRRLLVAVTRAATRNPYARVLRMMIKDVVPGQGALVLTGTTLREWRIKECRKSDPRALSRNLQ